MKMFPEAEAKLRQVAKEYKVTVQVIKSPLRTKTVAAARREFYAYCYNDLHMSQGEVSLVLGRKVDGRMKRGKKE